MHQNLAQELEFEACIPSISIDRFSPAQFIISVVPRVFMHKVEYGFDGCKPISEEARGHLIP